MTREEIEARLRMLESVVMKFCRKCERFQPLGNFRRGLEWDNHGQFCKTCEEE